MATVEFYHDHVNNEGVITFRIPDNELQKAELNPLARFCLTLSDGSPLDSVQNLLIILDGIEAAKETEKRNAVKQN